MVRGVETVDVVIVGGGIAGASVAYYLARLGARNVLVLEKGAVGAGASGRASGLVAFLTANHPGQAALLKASADLYDTWETEIGGAPALDRVGALLPTPEAERALVEREVAIMRAAGHRVDLLERDEAARLVPDWDLRDVAFTAYSPDSGAADPPAVTTALMNRARALGVRVYQGAEVTGIRTCGGRVVGVDSSRGPIDAGAVVIAAGAWSASIGRLVGAELAAGAVRHQALHLRPPASVRLPFPGCYDPANGIYFRPEAGGLVLAANAGPDDYPDEPPGDPDHFDPTTSAWYADWIVERLARRIPALADAEVVGGHAGVYPRGGDGFPLLGPLREARGLYCLCDTAGNGITSSPGLGRALAETIVYGRTFVDIHPFRPSRFVEGAPIGVPYRHAAPATVSNWNVG